MSMLPMMGRPRGPGGSGSFLLFLSVVIDKRIKSGAMKKMMKFIDANSWT